MKRFLAALFALLALGGAGTAQTLTLYTEISPPDQFIGADGTLVGYSIELVRELQRRIGNTDPVEVVPWVRGYKEIQSRPNVVLFSMARTPERSPLFEWVGPIRESVFSFFVKSDSRVKLKTLDDARKLPLIGVYKEDARDLYLTRQGFSNLDRSLDEITMFKKLMSGRIEALACNVEGYALTARTAGFAAEDIREAMPFLKVQVYIAFSKGTPEPVLKSWAAALESTKRDGFLEQLFKKYYPNRPLPGPAAAP